MKIVIISGSVFGAADEVARYVEQQLQAAGLAAQHLPGARLAQVLDAQPEALVTVTSSTGMGELPDNILGLYSELRDQLPGALRGQPGAILALGDSSYEHFCGGGELMRELYAELGIREVQDMLRVDASETADPLGYAESWIAQLPAALTA